jgi:hypothetical protein
VAKKQTADTAAPVTADDLREKLSSLQDQLQGTVDDQKSTIATALAGAGIVLLVVIFLLGKRAGRKKSTIVEIRRI